MADLDLVPHDYRRYQSFRGRLRLFAVVWLTLALGIGLARAGIAYAIEHRIDELSTLRELRNRESVQQARIAELSHFQTSARQRIAILQGLRGSLASRDLFLTVDRSLSGDIWFQEWKFRRAGEVVDHGPEAVHAGYFIVIPDLDPKEGEKAWRVDTHMELRAQAASHTTLSSFVSRLVEQDTVNQVRILNTQTRRYTGSDVVDFELAVVLETRP